jgi:hypothetical protein
MRDKVDAAPKAPAEAPARKPYRTPRLARLGTLTELTTTVGTSGKADHTGPPLRKTS